MNANEKALIVEIPPESESPRQRARQLKLRKLLESVQSEVGLQMARARRLELLATALGATNTQIDTINREARADIGFN